MRVLIFHGYLLHGTGSNVYNARLAAALVELGHEVHLFSQDRHPDERPFVEAVGDWDSGPLRVREVGGSRNRGAARCTVYRPDISGLLPVYVADRYEGIEARTFADCSEAEVERYVESNVAAVGEVARRVHPQLALANHLIMGPVILSRALAGETPYAVKIHGSALEYTVKPAPERFLPYAREGLAGARGVLVGSRHTALSLWSAVGSRQLPALTRLGPPGVDVSRFSPRESAVAAGGLRVLVRGLAAGGREEGDREGAFARDTKAAGLALSRLDPSGERIVAFVGKLIVSKGVDLLLAAWPLVLEQEAQSRLVFVGFGAFREGLERLCRALAAGALDQARELASAGRALEGAPRPGPLDHLIAFLDSLRGEDRERYVQAARRLEGQVTFVGRLEHEELAELLPVCDALVVPSTFPESFGMVAAEAAACGVLPISAAHSGLAEVSEVLATAVGAPVSRWLSFPVDQHVVRALAERLIAWLAAEPSVRSAARTALVGAVRERWSWEGVARGVLAASAGELEGLREP